jgi:DNA-binding Lrp family transcriptional regulator
METKNTIENNTIAQKPGLEQKEVSMVGINKKMRSSNRENTQPFCVNKYAEAFVLITTRLGDEEKIVQRLRTLEALKEAHSVHGSYDIIAKFMTKNYEDLTELLNKKVKNLSGVKGIRVFLIA